MKCLEYSNETMDNEIRYRYDTMMALVDAIIPRTPELAAIYGAYMYYGAVDYLTYEFLVMMLDYYYEPLSGPIADLLNYVALVLVRSDSINGMNDQNYSEEEIIFARLIPRDRFRTLMLLDWINLDYPELLAPFRNFPGIINISSSLNRYVMLGYYSEWYGYGSSRRNTPDQRTLEFYPPSWEQCGYPGPSQGYTAYVRQYYQIKENRQNGA